MVVNWWLLFIVRDTGRRALVVVVVCGEISYSTAVPCLITILITAHHHQPGAGTITINQEPTTNVCLP